MHRTNALSSTPSYSSLPLANEETVQYTPRLGTSLLPGGTFTRAWKPMTLTLHGQPFDVRRPVYHRHGSVAGELELKHPERVLALSVKPGNQSLIGGDLLHMTGLTGSDMSQLEGRIVLSVSDVGVRVVLTVEDDVVLWKKEEGASSQCPGILSFSLWLPSSFKEDGKSWKLPPTFEANFIGVPAIFSRCTYSLSISLGRVVKCGLMSWVKRKTYNLLVSYQPRKRPICPMPRFDSIFSSIKQLPDGWTQLTSTMGVKPGSVMKPLDCHFIVPANSSYSLSDTIPFHIQLLGSVGTLRELLPPSSSLLQPVRDRDTKVARSGFAIQVYIARQVTVDIRGQKSYRTLTIGTGAMWPVPPTDLELEYGSPALDIVCLDWEGEAKCWEEVTCGGFHAGSLHVKDYIVFALNPPLTKTVQLLPMHITHPVKFVTDPWLETDTVHPYDY